MLRNPSVGKRFFAAGLCVVLLLSLAACRENPDGSIVVHKDMDDLISKAQEGGVSKVEAADIADEVAENYESYQAFIEDESLGVTVNVNAKVDVPQVDKLSVYRVRQKPFTQEFVDKVRKVLMGDKAVYEATALTAPTKADFEGYIGSVRKAIADLEADKAAGFPTLRSQDMTIAENELEQAYEDQMKLFQGYLKNAEELYENAPAEVNITDYPSDGQLHTLEELYQENPEEYASQYEYMGPDVSLVSMITDGGDGWYAILTVENSPENGSSLSYRSSAVTWDMGGYSSPTGTIFPSPLDDDQQPYNHNIPENFLSYGAVWDENTQFIPWEGEAVSFSQKEAVAQGQAFLEELGLGDFAFDIGGLYNENVGLSSLEMIEYRPYYILRFRRMLDGVMLTQVSGVKEAGEFVDEGDYRARKWYGEIIELRINDAGIVGFDYTAPVEVAETVAENTGLRPFSDMIKIFESMICVVSADVNLESVYDIDRVRLSYSRISERDSFDTGLIVPVWSFEGTRTISFNGYTYPGKETGSFLEINAIDGTVIDKMAGY